MMVARGKKSAVSCLVGDCEPLEASTTAAAAAAVTELILQA